MSWEVVALVLGCVWAFVTIVVAGFLFREGNVDPGETKEDDNESPDVFFEK